MSAIRQLLLIFRFCRQLAGGVEGSHRARSASSGVRREPDRSGRRPSLRKHGEELKRGVCEHWLVWLGFFKIYIFIYIYITTYLSLQIKYGGTVPKSYYVQDSVTVQYDNSVTISRGSMFQLEYDIEAPSSLLRSSPALWVKEGLWEIPLQSNSFPLPGGSLLAMGQTSDSECTDAPKRAAGGKCLTCSRFCPASATTPTWSPKMAASPAPSPEPVSSFVRSSIGSAEPRYPANPSLMLT